MEPDAVREHLLAYQREGDEDRLDAAVRAADSMLAEGWQATDRRRALLETFASSALVLRSRTARARPDDLSRSIELGRSALGWWPQSSPLAATLQSNLAGSLSDRYEQEGRGEDLDEALELYPHSAATMRELDAPLATTLHGWGNAFHERAKRPGADSAADLGRAVERFTEALQQPDLPPDEESEIRNSLGLSLRALWETSNRSGALAGAEAALRYARELAPPGSATHTAATANLASVLQDRAERDDDPAALEEAVDLLQGLLRVDALRSASSADLRALRERVSVNLQTALVGQYWYSRDGAVLDAAVTGLRSLVTEIPAGPARTRVQAVLGAAWHETFERTGSLAALDEAVRLQNRVLGAEGETPGRLLNLGVSLLARFRRRHEAGDVVRALELFRRAAETSASRVERASAWNSAANARFAQQDVDGGDALDEVVELRRRAVAAAPGSSLDRALFAGNLGVDLLARYQLRRDERDLAEALRCQRRAVRTAPGAVPSPTLLAGLADTEAADADRRRSPVRAQRARRAYRAAFDAGQAAQRGTALGTAVSWSAWEAGNGRWREALDASERGLDVAALLVGGQERRADKESWLADAQELAAAGALSGARAGELRRAAVVLERGRAVLLADALRRRAVPRTAAGGGDRHEAGRP